MNNAKNVLGEPLQICSLQPLTGFYRDGCCNSSIDDLGLHIVCAEVTEEFLTFSQSRGNDLGTPNAFFPGLKPGDRWCLCAGRWYEAFQAGAAPPIALMATHEVVLKHIPLADLKKHALDLC